MTTKSARPWRPKTAPQWDRMDHRARGAWIAALTDVQLVAQAAVRGRATGRSVARVLVQWTLNGLITYEHKVALNLALDGLVGITPAAFYALAADAPFRAQLALALLSDDEQIAFAAACGAYLGALYTTAPIPAAVVAGHWARVGLIGGVR